MSPRRPDPMGESAYLEGPDSAAFEAVLRSAAMRLVTDPLPSARRLGVVATQERPARRFPGLLLPLLAGLSATAIAVAALQGPMAAPPSATGVGSVPTPSSAVATPHPARTGTPTPAGPQPTASPWPSAVDTPSPSPSAGCVEAFAIAVKAWAGTGMGQLRVQPMDKLTIARAPAMLGKAFGLCSATELAIVNGQQILSFATKVPGAPSPRFVQAPLIADVPALADVLCQDAQLARTRTCKTLGALTPPSPSRSP